jgi:hypothetical protein
VFVAPCCGLHRFAGKERTFTFDYSYNSFVPRDHGDYASQDMVYDDIGRGVLENAYEGEHCLPLPLHQHLPLVSNFCPMASL